MSALNYSILVVCTMQQVREERSEEQKDTNRIPLHAVQPHRQCRRQHREEPPRTGTKHNVETTAQR